MLQFAIIQARESHLNHKVFCNLQLMYSHFLLNKCEYISLRVFSRSHRRISHTYILRYTLPHNQRLAWPVELILFDKIIFINIYLKEDTHEMKRYEIQQYQLAGKK